MRQAKISEFRPNGKYDVQGTAISEGVADFRIEVNEADLIEVVVTDNLPTERLRQISGPKQTGSVSVAEFETYTECCQFIEALVNELM